MNNNPGKIMATNTVKPDLASEFGVNQVLACPGCDLLLKRLPLNPGERLSCPRCDEILQAPKNDSVKNTLVLSLTGLLIFPYAIFMPIMTLDTMGIKNTGTIFDGVISTWNSGYIFVAIILALTSVVFPLIKLSLLFCICLNLELNRFPKFLPAMMRTYIHSDEWGMLEVFMIGILVTIIKMHHMANIHYDAGFFCFVALMMVALGSSVMLDKDEFWNKIELEGN